MDEGIWIGLTIGGVISLLASIAANLLHTKLVAFLDKKKLVSHEKRRKKAMELNSVIRALHTGERNREIYFTRLTIIAFLCFAVAMVAFIGSGIVLAIIISLATEPSLDLATGFRVCIFLVMFLLTHTFLLLAYLEIQRLRRIKYATDNFAEYEIDFRNRWQ